MAGTLLDRRATAAATLLEATGRTVEDTIPLADRAAPGGAVSLPVLAVEGARTDFDLVGTLGEGGMGRVLLARQRSLSRDVAVKTVKDGATESDRAGLVREARISGSLEHPGIVPVHALGVDAEGRPLLVMKRIQGVDWETLLRNPAHPAWESVVAEGGDRLDANLEILGRICRALELAHSREIIHRDVKPSNVMVGPFGEVYLVDWGIAAPKGTRADALVGTPKYMAPEMLDCDPVDERTDVYLLGGTLHRVLVGRPRHRGEAMVDVIVSVAESRPFDYAADVPPELASLCNRATAKRPEERPPTVRAFREALASFSRNRGSIALHAAALERLDALDALLASSGSETPPDLVVAYRLATEARFGLMLCRRTYPDHAAARVALERCLRSLVDLELRAGNVDAAAAALDDLAEQDLELAARVDRAREEAAAKSREDERLRALDRDLDTSIARKSRIALFAGSAAGTAVIAGTALRAPTYVPGGQTLSIYSATSLIGSVLLVLAFRRHLFANAFNRRTVLAFLLLVCANAAERIFLSLQVTPLRAMFTSELATTITGVAIVAVVHMRRVGAVLVPLSAGIVAMNTLPYRPQDISAATLAAAYVTAAWALAGGRARHAEPPR